MKEYGKVRIGHVNDNVTEIEDAKIVKRETIGYREEVGHVREYTVEFKSGRQTTYVGCWSDEKFDE